MVFSILTKFGEKNFFPKKNFFSTFFEKNFGHPKNLEILFSGKPIVWGVKSCVSMRGSEICPLVSYRINRKKMLCPKNGANVWVWGTFWAIWAPKNVDRLSKSQFFFFRICVVQS